jgi:hypothetical protein
MMDSWVICLNIYISSIHNIEMIICVLKKRNKCYKFEELDVPAVSTLGVQSRKLSNAPKGR